MNPSRQGLIDCDVHVYPRNTDEIKQYMQMPWSKRYRGSGRGLFDNPVHGSRLDAVLPNGGPSGSDPDFLREQLLNTFDYA